MIVWSQDFPRGLRIVYLILLQEYVLKKSENPTKITASKVLSYFAVYLSS